MFIKIAAIIYWFFSKFECLDFFFKNFLKKIPSCEFTESVLEATVNLLMESVLSNAFVCRIGFGIKFLPSKNNVRASFLKKLKISTQDLINTVQESWFQI